MPLESRNHILLPDEPAFAQLFTEIHRFLGFEEKKHGRDQAGLPIHPDLADLTSRELDVLRLIASGAKNQDVANKLFLSEKTVRNYVSKIMTKVATTSRGETIALAHRTGLMDSQDSNT